MRKLIPFFLLAAFFVPISAQQKPSKPTYEVYAISYAIIPDFSVAGLVAGADRDRIVAHAMEALTGKWIVGREGRDVYGDGRASERVLAAFLSSSAGPSA